MDAILYGLLGGLGTALAWLALYGRPTRRRQPADDLGQLRADLTAYRGEVTDCVDRFERMSRRWAKRESREPDEAAEDDRLQTKRRILTGGKP